MLIIAGEDHIFALFWQAYRVQFSHANLGPG